MMPLKISKRSFLALACVALLAASCGEDDESKTPETINPPQVDDPDSPTVSATRSIVDVALANPDFWMLVQAVQRAGLVETALETATFSSAIDPAGGEH